MTIESEKKVRTIEDLNLSKASRQKKEVVEVLVDERRKASSISIIADKDKPFVCTIWYPMVEFDSEVVTRKWFFWKEKTVTKHYEIIQFELKKRSDFEKIMKLIDVDENGI